MAPLGAVSHRYIVSFSFIYIIMLLISGSYIIYSQFWSVHAMVLLVMYNEWRMSNTAMHYNWHFVLSLGLPGVCISFCPFLWQKKFSREFHFSFIQKISHLLLHTLTIFQVSYEYLTRKTVFLLQQTIRWAILELLRNCWRAALQPRVHWCEEVIVRCRQVRGLRRGRKDFPSKRFQGVFR